jgi:hypothetical protein
VNRAVEGEWEWEVINDADFERVRRIAVPGGWLYQVENCSRSESEEHGVSVIHHSGWHPPVFVPALIEITVVPVVESAARP